MVVVTLGEVAAFGLEGSDGGMLHGESEFVFCNHLLRRLV